MAVALVQRVPVDRISKQAKEVRFWRTVLTGIAGLLFGLGWLTAKGFALVWLALSWSVIAVRTGWQEARGPAGERGTG